MKLCRLIEWWKGTPPPAVDGELWDALCSQLVEATQELDRKEAVLGTLQKRVILAEEMMVRYRRQRNELAARSNKLEQDWPAIHKQYFVTTKKRNKA